jgi:hypothetical protein
MAEYYIDKDSGEEKEKRSVVFNLRLTETEMNLIQNEARRRKMKVADYCRYTMLALIGGELERKAREYFYMTISRHGEDA